MRQQQQGERERETCWSCNSRKVAFQLVLYWWCTVVTMARSYLFCPNVMRHFYILDQYKSDSNASNFYTNTRFHHCQQIIHFNWHIDNFFRWKKNNNVWRKFWSSDHTASVVNAACMWLAATCAFSYSIVLAACMYVCSTFRRAEAALMLRSLQKNPGQRCTHDLLFYDPWEWVKLLTDLFPFLSRFSAWPATCKWDGLLLWWVEENIIILVRSLLWTFT